MILEDVVRAGDVVGLRKILKTISGAVFEERDKNERTALMLACISGNMDVLSILLKAGARLSCRDKWGKTALMYAAQRGNIDVVKLLLKFRADTSDSDNAGRTVEEHIPSTCRCKDEIAALLREAKMKHLQRIGSSCGAEDEAKNEHTKHEIVTGDIYPPPFTTDKDILEFARRGDVDGIRRLLPQAGGVTVDGLNSRDQNGRTPLMVALLNGKTETMRLILNAGAETRCFDNAGKSVLFYAIAKRNMEALEMLIASKANIAITDSNGRTPLMEACMDANLRAAQILLNAGASTRPKDNLGRTALMYAVAKGSLDVVNALLDAGADPSATDTHGKSVEQYAISTLTFTEVSRILQTAIKTYKSKATMHKQNSMSEVPESDEMRDASPQGSSPKKTLSRSKSQQRVLSQFNPLANKSALEMVRTGDVRGLNTLLAGGLNEVSVNERDSKGRTAAMVACIYDKEDILTILLENGADLGAKDNQGKTVLFHAVSTGNIGCMKALMDAGATANTTDSFGRTPLIQACIFGNTNAMMEFIRTGSDVEASDMWGKSSLMYATSKGDLEAMRVLMNAGASVDAVDIAGKSVEEYGLSVRNFEAVKRVIHEEREKRKRQNSRPVVSPVKALSRANSLSPMMTPVGILDLARKGDRESVKAVLGTDASSVVVNDRDKNNRTPLILACLHSKRDIMDELLKVGAYVNQKDKWGKSALMYAVAKGDAEATRMLLDHKADPLDIDYEHRTVEEQSIASGRNCEEVLQLLAEAKERIASAAVSRCVTAEAKDDQLDPLDNGLEDDAKDAMPAYSVNSGGILNLARKGDGHSMRVALQRDCSTVVVDEQDKNGRTPLMLACLFAKRDIVQELVRVGANIHLYDKWGKTALMYAVSKGDVRSIRMLLEAGANPFDTDWECKGVDEQARPSCRGYDETMQLIQNAMRKKPPPLKKQHSTSAVVLKRQNSTPSPEKKRRMLLTQKSSPSVSTRHLPALTASASPSNSDRGFVVEESEKKSEKNDHDDCKGTRPIENTQAINEVPQEKALTQTPELEQVEDNCCDEWTARLQSRQGHVESYAHA